MHYKRNNKESKTYVQGLRSFGNTLPRGVKQVLRKSGFNYSEVISKWNILVGKDISNYCYPKSIKISRENKNGTLILSVERGNEINIEYAKKEIIKNIKMINISRESEINLINDPLRILRCFRFVSELNFKVDFKLITHIKKNKEKSIN